MIGGRATGVTALDVFTNGELETSNTVAINLMNTAPTTNYYLGDDASLAGNFNGQFYWGAVWDASLDPYLFREAYLNPYQLIERIERKLYFMPGEAVASTGLLGIGGSSGGSGGGIATPASGSAG
jgi:hypothetical protein